MPAVRARADQMAEERGRERAKQYMKSLRGLSSQGYRNLAIQGDMDRAAAVSRKVQPGLRDEE